MGVWAGVAEAGAFASLLVSGALLEFFPWPSIFALSVILAVLALAGTAAVVPTSKDADHATLDPAGAVLAVAGISGVVFAIIEGPALGWGALPVMAAFAVGALALVGFVLWELRSERPMLDPRLFLVGPFSAGALSMTMSHAAVFGLFFVALQYLQQIMGYSPLVSGLAVLPMVAAFVLSPASNHLSGRLGPAPVIAGGLVLAAAGMGVLATLGVGSSYWQVLPGFVLTGAGMALSAAPATQAIVASPEQSGRCLRRQRPLARTRRRSRDSRPGERAQRRLPLRPRGRGMPAGALARAQDSLASALGIARQLGGAQGARLAHAAREAYVGGLDASLPTGAMILVVAAVGTVLLARRRSKRDPASARAGDAPSTRSGKTYSE